MSLGWATDQKDPGLESAPNLDSTDGNDLPMHVDAALSLFKSVDNPTPSTGSSVTFAVVAANGGPAIARNVQVTDVLPAGLAYQSHTASRGTYDSVSGLWSAGDLTAGSSATLTITARVTATGPITITNTASIPSINQPDPNLGDNSDDASIYVDAPPPNEADLGVLKYVDNYLPYEGESIVFTVLVENDGPVTATNIRIADQLPSNVTYQSHSALTGVYNSETGIWSIPSLANGASTTLAISASVNAGTAGSVIPNVATVTALDQADPDPADNSATAEFFPESYEAGLSVLKYVNNALPYEASTIVFTVAVQNGGPVTATNIAVTDHLPAAATYESYSATSGTYSTSTGIWAIPALGSGASATLAITATVNEGTAGSTSFNTAAVTALDQPDLNSADDSSTAGFTPQEAPAEGPVRRAPAFSNFYVAIGAALGGAIAAYFIGVLLTARRT